MSEGFFEFRERITAKPAAPKTPVESAMTVTQLTAKIDAAIRGGVPGNVTVRGEVTNLNRQRQSGHLYFTLKDEGACISCAMWRSQVERLKFDPADGMELLATGAVNVYAQRGNYQLYVQTLQPLGAGALELAFQQMKSKLEKEGLFEESRKRRLPKYPTRLVLVTSRETAALQDMLKVLRRYPWVKIYVYHVPVQGASAAAQIAAGLEHLNRTIQSIGGADVVLLGRGGGSLEDLWAFNEEVVARAIAAMKIPVISGIGHEVDVSIADLVADYHAHTPTEAARVVMTHWEKVVTDLASAQTRLANVSRSLVQHARQKLANAERHEFFRRPTDRIHRLQQRIDDRDRALTIAVGGHVRAMRRRLDALQQRLQRNRPSAIVARWRAELVRREARLRTGQQRRLKRVADRLAMAVNRLARKHPTARIALVRERIKTIDERLAHAATASIATQRRELEATARHLHAIGPEQVLSRGFSLTLDSTGRVIRSAADVQGGDKLITRLADGQIESTVDGEGKGLFD